MHENEVSSLIIGAAKLRTYLRLSNIKLGLIINFHSPILKDGIIRIVNALDDPPQ